MFICKKLLYKNNCKIPQKIILTIIVLIQYYCLNFFHFHKKNALQVQSAYLLFIYRSKVTFFLTLTIDIHNIQCFCIFPYWCIKTFFFFFIQKTCISHLYVNLYICIYICKKNDDFPHTFPFMNSLKKPKKFFLSTFNFSFPLFSYCFLLFFLAYSNNKNKTG